MIRLHRSLHFLLKTEYREIMSTRRFANGMNIVEFKKRFQTRKFANDMNSVDFEKRLQTGGLANVVNRKPVVTRKPDTSNIIGIIRMRAQFKRKFCTVSGNPSISHPSTGKIYYRDILSAVPGAELYTGNGPVEVVGSINYTLTNLKPKGIQVYVNYAPEDDRLGTLWFRDATGIIKLHISGDQWSGEYQAKLKEAVSAKYGEDKAAGRA